MFLDSNYNVNNEPVFTESSVAFDQLINEAILYDEGIDLNEETVLALIDQNVLNERTIIKLDKFAKKARAIKLAALAIAREKGDTLFKKLAIIYKLKKKLIAAIMKKYLSMARSRVMKNGSALQQNTKVRELAAKPSMVYHNTASSFLKNKVFPMKSK